MDQFEQDLQRALARQKAPVGLEARILAAAAAEPKRAARWWRRRWELPVLPVRWATAGAMAVVLAAGILWQRERIAEQRLAGEEARAKLELALKITSAKLQRIEEHIAVLQEGN